MGTRFKQPRFKQPKLPPCQQRHEARAAFTSAHEVLRAARHKYKLAVWRQTEHLTGKALLRFALAAALRMKQSGLYAEATNLQDMFYCLFTFFFDQECARGDFASWDRWKAGKRIGFNQVGYLREYARRNWRQAA